MAASSTTAFTASLACARPDSLIFLRRSDGGFGIRSVAMPLRSRRLRRGRIRCEAATDIGVKGARASSISALEQFKALGSDPGATGPAYTNRSGNVHLLYVSNARPGVHELFTKDF